jgi:hypothetical protein
MELMRQGLCTSRSHHAGEFLDIKPGTKGTISLPGDDAYYDLRIRGEGGETRRQLRHHVRMKHIEGRIGKGHDSEWSLFLKTNHTPL